MEQVNFRLDENEKWVLDLIAKYKGQSVAEYSRSIIAREIRQTRVDIAFQLVKEGKIGFKRSWNISGLSYHEFITEWAHRNAEELIAEETEEHGYKLALKLDPKLLLKETK
jgi:uncharacterized protein (DUF1778 family)